MLVRKILTCKHTVFDKRIKYIYDIMIRIINNTKLPNTQNYSQCITLSISIARLSFLKCSSNQPQMVYCIYDTPMYS